MNAILPDLQGSVLCEDVRAEASGQASAQRAANGVSPGGRPVAPPGLGRLARIVTPVGDSRSSGPIRNSSVSPVNSAWRAWRTTFGSEHEPPIHPSTRPSAYTMAFAPGRTEAGASARTTVASTYG